MMDDTSKRPDIWDDDARMNVLFAPFRDKSLNPTSWNQKMKFWTDLLTENLFSNQDAVVDLKSLASRFERKGKIPSCINIVLDEMKGSGKLIALSQEPQLDNLSPKKGWLSWGYHKFVKSPVTWSLKLLQNSESGGTKYIFVEVLKDKCRRLVDRHYCEALCDITDSMVEFTKLLDRNRDICKSDLEFYLIIEELVKEKKVVVHQENSQVYVKFCCRTDSEVKPVQESDLQILRIKTASHDLMTKIEALTTDIDRLTDEAKDYKKKNMIPHAMRCLRERKRLNKRIEKLSGSLDLLDDILGRLRHAVSDEMVIKAIETGTSALKEYTSKTGIDQVTSTLDNLAEVMGQQNEMESELSMMSTGTEDLNQSELELELSDLLNESKKPSDSLDELADALAGLDLQNISIGKEDLKVREIIDELPDVPTYSPSASSKSLDKERKDVQLAS